MPLKAVIDTTEGLAAEVAALYTKGADGKWSLNVEGMVPSAKVDEFRQNNIELKKQLEKFDGIDPEKYKELSKLEQQKLEKQLIEAGEVDKLVELRTSKMKQEYEEKLTGTSTERDSAKAALSVLLIDSAVQRAAAEAGILPTALDDIVLRAKTVFSIDKDGNVVAKNAKGEPVYDGNSQPLGIAEWIKELKAKTAPHLFAGMTGGGAPGSNKGPGQDTSKMSPTQKLSAGFAARAGA